MVDGFWTGSGGNPILSPAVHRRALSQLFYVNICADTPTNFGSRVFGVG